jgi:hypothetical protein
MRTPVLLLLPVCLRSVLSGDASVLSGGTGGFRLALLSKLCGGVDQCSGLLEGYRPQLAKS